MGIRFIFSSLILVLGLSTMSFSAPGKRIAAKRCIRRTTVVMVHAHKKLKEGNVYTGNMSRSVRHQRYARILYRQGKYLRAVHHSRRARQLAFMVIKANNGTVDKEWEFNKEENEGIHVSDEELDKELPADSDNLTDEGLSKEDLKDIDLKDND